MRYLTTDESSNLTVDAIVIGGGIQGLWVLKDLVKNGFCVLLLEVASLGAGQTSHAHSLVHRGHFFRSKNLFQRLDQAAPLWQEWIGQERTPILGKAYCVFSTLNERTSFDQHWDAPDQTQRPSVIENAEHVAFPAVDSVYECESPTFSAPKLLEWLCQDCENLGYRRSVLDVSEIKRDEITGVFHVVIMTPSGDKRVLQAPALILAAGASNRGLITQMELDPESDRPIPQARLTHMLAILETGNQAGILPEFAGQIFRKQKAEPDVLIATRVVDGRTTWLVSNGAEPSRILYNRGKEAFRSNDSDKGEFVDKVLRALEEAQVSWLRNPNMQELLRFRVFETPKAEAYGALHTDKEWMLPQSEAVKKLSAGCYAVWPNLLTLAPLASQTVVTFLAQDGISPSKIDLSQLNLWEGDLELASERWVSAESMTWDELARMRERRPPPG